MTSLGKKLHRAKQSRQENYKDVPVIIDDQIASERAKLLEELEQTDESDDRLAGESVSDAIRERLEALSEAAQDAMITLRFRRLPGKDWAELTSRHPVRLDSVMDRQLGYNYDAVCWAAAQVSGVLVEGEEEVPLKVTAASDTEIAVNEWDDLLDALPGSSVQAIRDAVWAINEWEPQQRLNILVKGSGAATRSVTK